MSQLQVVIANSALRLKAILDFEEQDRTRRVAGDEWLFEGPGELDVLCVVCCFSFTHDGFHRRPL